MFACIDKFLGGEKIYFEMVIAYKPLKQVGNKMFYLTFEIFMGLLQIISTPILL